MQVRAAVRRLLNFGVLTPLLIIIIIQKLVVENTYETIFILAYVLAYLALRVAKLRNYCLNNFFV